MKIEVAELRNCGIVALDYSENSGRGIAELRTSGIALRKIAVAE